MQKLIIAPWKNINVIRVEEKLDEMLFENRSRVRELLAAGPCYTWENFMQPIEDMNDALHMLWFPICHLDEVAVSQDEVVCKLEREAFKRCQQKISNQVTKFLQNKKLFLGHKYLLEHCEELHLSLAQCEALEQCLQDFRLSGVDLPSKEKKRYRQNVARLAELGKQFEDNVVDSTHPRAWSEHIIDVERLAGVPEDAIKGMRIEAAKRKLNGYLVTLGESTYSTVLENAHDRKLRKDVYEARISRASKRGPNAGQRDNAPGMDEALALRHENAKMLGFANPAELSLETMMAESTTQVMDFLNSLMEKAKEAALREYKEIAEYAKWHDGIETLEHWDIRYYLKQVKESKYAFSQEELAQYFSVSEVLLGSFAILKKLYNISFVEREEAELWHTDAKLLEVYKDGKNLTAGLCTDLGERPGGKSGGAWMNEMVLRRKLQDGTIQLPVGVLVANFRSASDGAPSLLSIDEVESTLLHELGHEAHLLLTTQGVRSVSGLNGVPIDGIELPSQFMENFCWQRESLDMLAHHYKTGEKIPDELFEKVLASRTFGKAHEMVWLAGRALFDFRLHMEYDSTKENQVESIYQEVCNSVQPISPFYTPWAPESFTHVFGGQFGHFAWYYSYPWALVLAAEVFAKFIRADGSIDWSVGRKLEEELLSLGGSRPFMVSVVKFLGHSPSVEPLLRQFGFIE